MVFNYSHRKQTTSKGRQRGIGVKHTDQSQPKPGSNPSCPMYAVALSQLFNFLDSQFPRQEIYSI
jgi:hypothetical protein